jgi:hypothetical protein
MKHKPKPEFSEEQIDEAIESFLEYGRSTLGTGHQGAYSGVGFPARCLRFHLEKRKTTRELNRRFLASLRDQLVIPTDVFVADASAGHSNAAAILAAVDQHILNRKKSIPRIQVTTREKSTKEKI